MALLNFSNSDSENEKVYLLVHHHWLNFFCPPWKSQMRFVLLRGEFGILISWICYSPALLAHSSGHQNYRYLQSLSSIPPRLCLVSRFIRLRMSLWLTNERAKLTSNEVQIGLNELRNFVYKWNNVTDTHSRRRLYFVFWCGIVLQSKSGLYSNWTQRPSSLIELGAL